MFVIIVMSVFIFVCFGFLFSDLFGVVIDKNGVVFLELGLKYKNFFDLILLCFVLVLGIVGLLYILVCFFIVFIV